MDVLLSLSFFNCSLDSAYPLTPEEYMLLCRKYPGAHIKTVRSHLMKFFYKYFLKHADLRDRTSTTNSYDGFDSIIADLRAKVGDDEQYEEVSYSLCCTIRFCTFTYHHRSHLPCLPPLLYSLHLCSQIHWPLNSFSYLLLLLPLLCLQSLSFASSAAILH